MTLRTPSLLFALLAACLLPSSGRAATEIWPVSDASGQLYPYIQIVLIPGGPFNNNNGGYSITNAIYKFNADSNSVATMTNLLVGTYTVCAVSDGFSTCLNFSITNYNSTNYLTNNSTVVIQPGATNAYSQDAANHLFVSLQGTNTIIWTNSNGQVGMSASISGAQSNIIGGTGITVTPSGGNATVAISNTIVVSSAYVSNVFGGTISGTHVGDGSAVTNINPVNINPYPTYQIYDAPFFRLTTPAAATNGYYGIGTPFLGAVYAEISYDSLNWINITPFGIPVAPSDSVGIHDAALLLNTNDNFYYGFFTHQPASLSQPAPNFLVLKSGPGLTNIGKWTIVATPAMTNDSVSWIWVATPFVVTNTNYVLFTIGTNISGDATHAGRQIWVTQANSNFTTFGNPTLLATNENNSYNNHSLGDPVWLGTVTGTNYLAAQNLQGSSHYDLYYSTVFPGQMHLLQTNIVNKNSEAGGVVQVIPGTYRWFGNSLDALGEPFYSDSTSPYGPWNGTFYFLTNEQPFVTFPHGNGIVAINTLDRTNLGNQTFGQNVNINGSQTTSGSGSFGAILQATSATSFGPALRLNGGTESWYFGSGNSADGFGAGVLYIYDFTQHALRTSMDTSGNVTINSGNLTMSSGSITASSGSGSFGSILQATSTSSFGPALRLNGATENWYIGSANTADGIGAGRFYVYDQTAGKFVIEADTSQNFLVVSGNAQINTIGKTLIVTSGSNAKIGTATANGTTEVAVNTTAVTANSLIFLTEQSPAGTPGAPYISHQTNGVGFGFKSVASDTSTVGWFIVEKQ